MYKISSLGGGAGEGCIVSPMSVFFYISNIFLCIILSYFVSVCVHSEAVLQNIEKF